jgi:eukaryotic-like serine/threonine-protein kinase
MGNKPQIGSLFADRYEIQSVLGEGGMGIVYEAYDRALDDVVAIKTLRCEVLTEHSPMLGRFKQEIRLARRITHPNVLRTYDLGDWNGLKFLSMEFVKGMTLKHLIESSEILPTDSGLRIGKQICEGLAAAHDVGVVHRDVTSQNIIIELTGGLKIMDFGTACVADHRAASAFSGASAFRTASAVVIGTPSYMSPEQVHGLPVDFRSDIYSTGVVLYELFTGSLPFEGDSPLAVVLKHVNEVPPSPRSKNPWIEPGIAAIVMRCLEKDPGARFQSMRELYEALAKVRVEQAA